MRPGALFIGPSSTISRPISRRASARRTTRPIPSRRIPCVRSCSAAFRVSASRAFAVRTAATAASCRSPASGAWCVRRATRKRQSYIAPNPRDPQEFQITHPFHPLRGRPLRVMGSKQICGEERITFQRPDGAFCSVVVGWTDRAACDPYHAVGQGRSRFRVEDLLALAELAASRKLK